MSRPRNARARGNWPESASTERLEPTVPVTFNMPTSLYEWLANFSGGYSYFLNVEESLVTAVRCMAGVDHEDGCDLASLINWTAEAKGVNYAQVFMRDTLQNADTDAVTALLSAASLAASNALIVDASQIPDDPKQAALIRQLLVVAGLNINEKN